MVYVSNVLSLFQIYPTDETNFTCPIFQDMLMWFISYASVSGELCQVHTGIHWPLKFTSNHTCSDNGTQSNTSNVAYLGTNKLPHFTHIILTRDNCVVYSSVNKPHVLLSSIDNQIHGTRSYTSNVVYLGMNKPQQCSQINLTRIDYYQAKEVIDPLHPYFQTYLCGLFLCD
jgi:hypothetical protein